MTKANEYIQPYPDEQLPDSGAARFGCIAWLLFFFASLFFVPLAISLLPNSNTGNRIVSAAIFLAWLMILGFMIRRNITRRPKPEGVDVLRDVLNFDIGGNYYDVGAAAVCRPDEAAPGDAVAFLVFMQNYSSWKRQMTLKMPKKAILGELSGAKVRFQIGPGQCAVYRHVVRLQPDVQPGHFLFSASFKPKFVGGQGGGRLIAKSKKEPGLMLVRPRQLCFSLDIKERIAVDAAANLEQALPAPVYLSLYTPGMLEPRFEVLQQISAGAAGEPINVTL